MQATFETEWAPVEHRNGPQRLCFDPTRPIVNNRQFEGSVSRFDIDPKSVTVILDGNGADIRGGQSAVVFDHASVTVSERGTVCGIVRHNGQGTIHQRAKLRATGQIVGRPSPASGEPQRASSS
jgi:hypothetical protein